MVNSFNIHKKNLLSHDSYQIKKYFIIAFFLLIFSGVASAQRLAVSVHEANVRSGPGTKYEIAWKVEKYYPVSIIKKSGGWYKFIDFEGDQGWIYQPLVHNIPAVITKKEKCNIRSGPGTKFNVVFIAENGIPFKLIKRKKDWLNIQHADGDKGWIHKSLVW
jgi:SH3-like domain-containing protein